MSSVSSQLESCNLGSNALLESLARIPEQGIPAAVEAMTANEADDSMRSRCLLNPFFSKKSVQYVAA